VTAFSDWEGGTGSKRKVWFGVPDGEPFAFADVWGPTPEGDRMAFLTCEPNSTAAAVHPRAMLVVLPSDNYGAWLGGPDASACALAVPYPEGRLARV
jgi:putative SOS response-associated peptidase YedK